MIERSHTRNLRLDAKALQLGDVRQGARGRAVRHGRLPGFEPAMAAGHLSNAVVLRRPALAGAEAHPPRTGLLATTREAQAQNANPPCNGRNDYKASPFLRA